MLLAFPRWVRGQECCTANVNIYVGIYVDTCLEIVVGRVDHCHENRAFFLANPQGKENAILPRPSGLGSTNILAFVS